MGSENVLSNSQIFTDVTAE